MSKGFTFIELMLMVVVLGVLAVLYTSSTGDLSDVSIDAVSRKVQSDIRYAHQLATSTSGVYGANFVAGGGYEIYQGSPGHPVKDPVTREDMVVNLADFQGVVITTNYRVEFNARGEPTTGADSRVRLTASSGAIRDVYVVDRTGAVVVDLIQYGTGCRCDLCEDRLN